MTKRIVILGGSGFVGRHLAKLCETENISVVSLSSKDIDLSEKDAVEKLSCVVQSEDALVFASCITREKGEDLPTLRKNLAMAEAVGQIIEKRGCAHATYLSSDAVYKDGLALVNEDSEMKPSGLYGATHVMREKMMQHCSSKAGVPLMILRPSAIYGAGDTHNGYGPNRFLKQVFGADGKITLFGQGEEKRDHIFVGDVCRIIEKCINSKTTGILNVVTGKSLSFSEVARAVVENVNREVVVECTPRNGAITHRHFDKTHMIKMFPSFTCSTLQQGIQQTVATMQGKFV